MRAARFHAAKDVRVEEIPAPQPDDDDDKVLVEVEWCGICGSDLGEYLSGTLRTDLSPAIRSKSLLTKQATQAHTQSPLPKRAHTL
jgi:Zn-dependent alcohol dehydrogenase